MSTTQWQSKLMSQGAKMTLGAVDSFGNTQEEFASTKTGNILCDLSHLGLLEVSGDDSLTFLQGQVTNDVKLLTGNNAHYTGYCSPKGRLLALFLAFAHQDHLHLQLPKVLLAPIMKRLNMYVLRSKVSIIDTAESIANFGINGPNATRIVSSLFSTLPLKDYQLVSLEEATIIKLPSVTNQARYQIFSKQAFANNLWDKLTTQCQLVGKPCWDWLEIHAGIPEIIADTQEQFVPQMVNLDLLDGINFKKGCYTGQEIVARTHYLGSVKRRTFLASLSSQKTPVAGDKLLDELQNEVGQLVRVAPSGENQYDVLAEIRIEAQKTSKCYCNNNLLTFKQLPYSLGLDET